MNKICRIFTFAMIAVTIKGLYELWKLAPIFTAGILGIAALLSVIRAIVAYMDNPDSTICHILTFAMTVLNICGLVYFGVLNRTTTITLCGVYTTLSVLRAACAIYCRVKERLEEEHNA